jgi:methyl-accepting chemotaxis protein
VKLPRLPGSSRSDPRDPREALRAITRTCTSASAGDLEPRVPRLGTDPDLVAARVAVNHLLDVLDAYVRESSAAIYASSHGRYYRRLLEGGLLGVFREGARTIDSGREAMQVAAENLTGAATGRVELAEDLESTVLGVSEQVAAAAQQMGTTADGVVVYAKDAVQEAARATETVHSLRASTDEIRASVD